MLKLKNPIPSSSKDSIEVKTALMEFNLVPMFGDSLDSNNSFVEVLTNINQLCPSYQACKNDIANYAFSKIIGYANTRESVSESIAQAYIDRNKNLGIQENHVDKIIEHLFDNLSDYGNAYVRVTIMSNKLGQKVTLTPVDVSNLIQFQHKGSEVKQCLISEKISIEYWKKNKPAILPINLLGEDANWVKTETDGITATECVFHMKTKRDKSTYYGRPISVSILNWMYAEYQAGDSIVKGISTELVAKYIAFFEEVNPERQTGTTVPNLNNGGLMSNDSVDAVMQKFRKLTTVEGEDPKTIIGMKYPYGQKKPEIERLEVFRDTAYTKEVISIASSYIYSAWGWAKELTGMSSTAAGIGGNILIDMFLIKNMSVVRPTQELFASAFAQIIDSTYKQLGINEEALQPVYKDSIFELISIYNANNNTNGNSPI